MTPQPRSSPTTSARLQGMLFVQALEAFSLYLQHDDAGLQRKLDELSDHELRLLIRQTSNFYHTLTGKDDHP